jgi:hypothetical protein
MKKKINSAVQRDLRNLSENLGGIANAARIVGVGSKTLQNYIDGTSKEIGDGIWEDLKQYIKKDKNQLLTEISKELYTIRKVEREQGVELAISSYKENRQETESLQLLEQMSRQPLITYFEEYHYNPIGLLEVTKRIRKGEEISIANLAVNMYRFASLYSLFRPNQVTHGHPYWGTVDTMDNIYSTLSSVYGQDLDYHFSNWGSNTISTILRRQPLEKEKVEWESLERDLEFTSKAIDKTIIEYSFENAGFYNFNYRMSFFHDLVTKFLTENSDGVVLEEGADSIIISSSSSVSLTTNIGTLIFHNIHNLFYLLGDHRVHKRRM